MNWIDLVIWVVPMYILYYGTMIIFDVIKSKRDPRKKEVNDVYEIEDEEEETTDVVSLFKEKESTDSTDSMGSRHNDVNSIKTEYEEVNNKKDDYSLDVESLKYQALPVKEYVDNAKKMAASVAF